MKKLYASTVMKNEHTTGTINYYKILDEKYGIEIVKTEYRPDCTKVENKSIKYVTNDEIEANEILNIFKENQVTPINSEEVIMDLFRKKF